MEYYCVGGQSVYRKSPHNILYMSICDVWSDAMYISSSMCACLLACICKHYM